MALSNLDADDRAHICSAADVVDRIMTEYEEELEFNRLQYQSQCQHQKKFESVITEIELFRRIGHYWLRKPSDELKTNNQYLTDIIIENYVKSNEEDDEDIYEYSTLHNIKEETFEGVKIHLLEEYCWHVVFGYYDTFVKISELFFKLYIPYNIIQKMHIECRKDHEYREIDTTCNWKDFSDLSLSSYYANSEAKVELPEEYTTEYVLDTQYSTNIEEDNDDDSSDDEEIFSGRHIHVLRHLMDINKFQNYKFSYKVDSLFTWNGLLEDYIDLTFISSHLRKHTFD